MAVMMSLVLGSGFAITNNSALAQNFESNNEYLDESFPDSTKDESYNRDDFRPDKPDRSDIPRPLDVNFYVVIGEPYTETFEGAADLISTASCDEGDEVTDGGFKLTSTPDTTGGPAPSDADMVSDKPFENGVEGWEATATSEAGPGIHTLTAYAVCFDNQPLQQEEPIVN